MTDEKTDEFKKVIRDFVGDLKQTFPEYEPLINKWWKDKSLFAHIENEDEREIEYRKAEDKSIKFLTEYCKKKLPPRFFDILYQNDDMFKENSTVDTEFLPHIHFKSLWEYDITQKTRDIIWKYLQLILFSIVGSVENKDVFGDTAKLFESVNEEEFKSKLAETMAKMQDLFEKDTEKSDASPDASPDSNSNTGPNIPNANDFHQHISGMLDGKLGRLAKEIAEETANDLNLDMDNMTDMKGVFDKLIKNPTKLMGLVKNVGDKIDNKIKSGELKESELISEATEMMNKMKNMPGMDDIQSLLQKMGMGGAKVNMPAMEAKLGQNLKMAKMKERMNAKAQDNRAAREASSQQQQSQVPVSNVNQQELDEKLINMFTEIGKPERSSRGAAPAPSVSTNNKKKKKGKK
jgi:hypothetical protein